MRSGPVAMLLTMLAVLMPMPGAEVSGIDDLDGRLSLILEQAVPWTGLKDGGLDLHIALESRQGTCDQRGWAWIRPMAATEHPLRVVAQRVEGVRLYLVLACELLDQFPHLEGGQARIELDLVRYGNQLRGDYVCTTSVPDEKERQRRWRATLGVDYPPELVRGRVEAGVRRSRSIVSRQARYGSVQPILLTGRIDPPVPTWEAIAAEARPRLLGGDPAVLAAAVRSGPGKDWRAQLDVLLDGRGGALRPGGDGACDGYRAAGLALRHLLAGDAADGPASAEAARAALAQLDHQAARRWRYARELAGLAVAYDCSADAWPAELRSEVAARLLAEAWHLSGMAGITRDAVFAEQGLIGVPSTPADPGLALLRAAGLLAAVAVAGDEPDTETAQRNRDALAVCVRSLARSLQHSFGDRGAPVGHGGTDELVELVLPAAAAGGAAIGRDLFARAPGARQFADWCMVTAGLALDGAVGRDGPWLPLLLSSLPSARRPAALGHLQAHPAQLANPLQAVWAIAALPTLAGVTATSWSGEAVVRDDGACGSLALVGPPERGAFTTIIETAQLDDAAVGAMGRFSIAGLGREWIRRPAPEPGDLRWPDYREQNLLFVAEATAARLSPVEPIGGGRVQRVRVSPRGGSGSMGWLSGGFRAVAKKAGDRPTELEGAKTWTTIGVDYSGRSGADALLVAVAGFVGFQGRPVTWSMDIGSVAEEEVRFVDNRFEVRPSGIEASMVGTVVYPPGARFRYVAPSGTLGARVEVWMQLPPPDLDDAFVASLEAKILELERYVEVKGGTGSTVDGLDFDDLEDLDAPDARQLAAREEVSRPIKAKVFRVTTDTSMGAPTLRTRVSNHVVLALSIQRGAAPEVTVAPIASDPLLHVGEQTVHYWEYCLEFEQGMRDAIRAHPTLGGGGR